MSQARSDKSAGRRSRAQGQDTNPAPHISSTERSGAPGTANRANVPVAETRFDSSSHFDPTHDEIAARAYQCWRERGCPDGSPEIDWSRAEQELRGGRRARAASPAL